MQGCTFVAQHRRDVQYAVKEITRGMANPRKADGKKLVCVAKYFVGEPRKSTSDGLACLGDHVVKSWSSTQSIIALSTGKAELYAISRTAATALGLQSLLTDLGVQMDIRVFTDAAAGKSIATRRGRGKVCHISVNELWIQEKVSNGVINIVKMKNKLNTADLPTKHLPKAEIAQIFVAL